MLLQFPNNNNEKKYGGVNIAQSANISAAEARKRLEDGNQRYISGKVAQHDLGEDRRTELSTTDSIPLQLL
jgi:hypothetical protein